MRVVKLNSCWSPFPLDCICTTPPPPTPLPMYYPTRNLELEKLRRFTHRTTKIHHTSQVGSDILHEQYERRRQYTIETKKRWRARNTTMNTSIQRPQRTCHHYRLPTLQRRDPLLQIDVRGFQHRDLLLCRLQFEIHISDHSLLRRPVLSATGRESVGYYLLGPFLTSKEGT